MLKKLSYTAEEIDDKLGIVSQSDKDTIEELVSKMTKVYAVLNEVLNKGVFTRAISSSLDANTSSICGNAVCGLAICGTN